MAKIHESVNFYSKMAELQDRLRKSEEERLQLEEKFGQMMRERKEENDKKIHSMKEKYAKFLEEDKYRRERNERILQTLDRIENQAAILAAKTERLRLLRRHYESCVGRTYPSWRERMKKRLNDIDVSFKRKGLVDAGINTDAPGFVDGHPYQNGDIGLKPTNYASRSFSDAYNPYPKTHIKYSSLFSPSSRRPFDENLGYRKRTESDYLAGGRSDFLSRDENSKPYPQSEPAPVIEEGTRDALGYRNILYDPKSGIGTAAVGEKPQEVSLMLENEQNTSRDLLNVSLSEDPTTCEPTVPVCETGHGAKVSADALKDDKGKVESLAKLDEEQRYEVQHPEATEDDNNVENLPANQDGGKSNTVAQVEGNEEEKDSVEIEETPFDDRVSNIKALPKLKSPYTLSLRAAEMSQDDDDQNIDIGGAGDNISTVAVLKKDDVLPETSDDHVLQVPADSEDKPFDIPETGENGEDSPSKEPEANLEVENVEALDDEEKADGVKDEEIAEDKTEDKEEKDEEISEDKPDDKEVKDDEIAEDKAKDEEVKDESQIDADEKDLKVKSDNISLTNEEDIAAGAELSVTTDADLSEIAEPVTSDEGLEKKAAPPVINVPDDISSTDDIPVSSGDDFFDQKVPAETLQNYRSLLGVEHAAQSGCSDIEEDLEEQMAAIVGDDAKQEKPEKTAEKSPGEAAVPVTSVTEETTSESDPSPLPDLERQSTPVRLEVESLEKDTDGEKPAETCDKPKGQAPKEEEKKGSTGVKITPKKRLPGLSVALESDSESIQLSAGLQSVESDGDFDFSDQQ